MALLQVETQGFRVHLKLWHAHVQHVAFVGAVEREESVSDMHAARPGNGTHCMCPHPVGQITVT